MSQQNEGLKCFTAGEALVAYARVKLSSASGYQVEYADAGDVAIGLTQEAVDSGDPVTVRLFKKTYKMVAAGTFSIGATLYAADDGKVDDVSTGSAIGTALEACTAAGDIVEVLPA